MRMIDADAVRLKFQQIFDIYRETIDAVKCRPGAVEGAIKLCTQYLDEQPTIEAEPVRHGRWITIDSTTAKCSCCGWWQRTKMYYLPDDIIAFSKCYRFCTSCGVQMVRPI